MNVLLKVVPGVVRTVPTNFLAVGGEYFMSKYFTFVAN